MIWQCQIIRLIFVFTNKEQKTLCHKSNVNKVNMEVNNEKTVKNATLRGGNYRGKKNVRRYSIIEETAEVVKKSKRYVRMVMDGDRENEKIVEVFMAISDGRKELLEAVKQLVPFD